jgi:DNA-binding CsgD family transcriptional regulator
MEILEDALNRISRSGEAAFAMDGAGRITYWNKACEGLLGRPARHVIGKHCYEVMCGRDVNDNIYCHTSCPVAHQARQNDDPVHPFHIRALAGNGRRTDVEVSMFAVPSYHPALTSVVHVLRPAAVPAEAAAAAPAPVTPRQPVPNPASEAAVLTSRELDVLRCLSKGLTTPATAKTLSIAHVTVRNHIQAILQKLDVHSKLEAVVRAHALGIA